MNNQRRQQPGPPGQIGIYYVDKAYLDKQINGINEMLIHLANELNSIKMNINRMKAPIDGSKLKSILIETLKNEKFNYRK